MSKYCIIICGGGGKTTISKKYPDKYLDIDYFIWNELDKNKLEKLSSYIENNNININKLSEFYQNEMKYNKTLRNDKRIILTHHPDNALWLDRKILDIIRPSKNLHLKNIEKRLEKYKNLAINDWNNLTKYKPYEYKSFTDLENQLNLIHQHHK